MRRGQTSRCKILLATLTIQAAGATLCSAQEPTSSRHSGLEQTERLGSPQRATNSFNPIARIQLESLEQTRSRPLFSPARRATDAPLEANNRIDQPIVLLGAIASGPESIAIVRDEASKAVTRLKIGQSISGWQLLNVDGRTAKLASSTGTQIMLQIPLPAPK